MSKSSHPTPAVRSCKCPDTGLIVDGIKGQLEHIAIKLKAAVKALSDVAKTKPNDSRRRPGSEYRLKMLNPDSALVVGQPGPPTSGPETEFIDLMDVEVSDSENNKKTPKTYAVVTSNRPVKERIGAKFRPTLTPTPRKVKSSGDSKLARAKKLPVKPAFIVSVES